MQREAISLPLSATLLMSTPCSAAMKPSTENTTKPAKKLVPLLMMASKNASLQRERKEEGREREREQGKTEEIDIVRKTCIIIML